MKKTFYILIFISFFNLTFGQTGQNDYAVISGRALTNESGNLKSFPIKNAEIILNTLDSAIVTSTMTNDSGFYSFKVKRSYGKINLRVMTTAYSTIPTRQKYSFMSANEKVTADISKNNIVKDFYLTPFIPDIPPPPLLFKANSVEMYWDKSDYSWGDTSPEDAIIYLAKVLKDNPKMTVQISAHCDSEEKRAKCLSSKRAKFIKESLVKNGIDKKRIKTKGHGAKKPLISAEIIDKASTDEEKNLLHQKNRRATMQVLTFDDDE